MLPRQLLAAMFAIFITFNQLCSASTYNRSNYLPRSLVDKIDHHLDSNATEIKEGISLLKEYPYHLKDLPLCVNYQLEKSATLTALKNAIQSWNTASIKLLSSPVFNENCLPGKSDVEIIFSSDSGDSNDGTIKFGEVLNLKDKSPRLVLLLRKKELNEFEQLLSKMRDQQIIDKKMNTEQKKSFGTAFEKYRMSKTEKMINQVIIHELGHVLGLGHNFNSAEQSVMDYSDQSTLSDYDFDALKYRFNSNTPPAHHWKAIQSP